MRRIPLVLVVCALAGLLAIGAAAALATGGDARGGHAVAPKTTKAPLLPKQKRGWIGSIEPALASTKLAPTTP